ncbi:hypothetical protein F444_00788 [Phytophthora nicotianae P1976]|uniref:RNase H type-1 domain-containing protein n=1 Tax=Phytophthora nicotianae P1976 TaxID=1317066 RepID=A0A081B340_PHYNI|nr:hypothetical protein F444_00788 [Phytophthora nicotianae P1976]
MLRVSGPSAVETSDYEWPTKMLLRPRTETGAIRMVQLHPRPQPVLITMAKPLVSNSQAVWSVVKPEVPLTSRTIAVQTDPVMVNVGTQTDFPDGDIQDASSTLVEPACSDRASDRCAASQVAGVSERLESEYTRVMQLRDQLSMLPELQDLRPECNIEKADVGEPGVTTTAQDKQLRDILERHKVIFLGEGNAAPAPGVICDLDVGGARPVAQRPRSIAPHLAVKVYQLLKKLLETGLIEHSESPWASPIVIVLNKNGALWFMSLDMASGFWAIRMTERAKLISAFVCPFGHFQWVRMPFGLKNAPLVYQHVINNCLWGFVRLPPEEEALVDPEVLDYLKLEPQDTEPSEMQMADGDHSEQSYPENHITPLTDQMTVFKRNIPAPPQMGPVLGRSSYIDDIAHGAPTWDQLCNDLDALLYRLRYWNISVSLPKSEFGKRTIPYLSHEIGAEGIRAVPKIVKGIEELPFPKTLKGIQSFLGSLNYYHKFIEDYPVVAAVLYELTDEQIRAGRNLTQAKEAIEILKRRSSQPRCFGIRTARSRVIQPVRFTGRVLHDAELKYHIAEKEVLAVIRVIRSKTAGGRAVPWGVALSQYDLDIRKVQKDEDGLSAILGAGITPREHLDEIAESLIPAKGRIKAPPVVSIEMLEEDYQGVVLSFDGAAKTSTRRGTCGCILWRLPAWKVIEARGYILDDVTVNDSEYYGLLHGLKLAREHDIQDLVVVGDSRIVIQQVQGLINCNQRNLQRRLAEC